MTGVLFFDFDGVVHADPCAQRHHFSSLPLIEDVLREFAQVNIVLSTTWRLRQPADTTGDHLKCHFSPDIAERVVGVTPNYLELDAGNAPAGIELYPREWECIAWLRANRPEGERWIALDDKAHLFRPFNKNLIVTNAATGFLERNAIQLRRLLGEM